MKADTERLVLQYVDATFRQYEIVGAVIDIASAHAAVLRLKESQIEMDNILRALSGHPKTALRSAEDAAYQRQTQIRASVGRKSIYHEAASPEVLAILEPAIQEHWKIVGRHADAFSDLLA